MLTQNQIRWASQHDWFVADLGDGQIQVRDGWTLDGELFEQVLSWTGTFTELRAWAGY